VYKAYDPAWDLGGSSNGAHVSKRHIVVYEVLWVTPRGKKMMKGD